MTIQDETVSFAGKEVCHFGSDSALHDPSGKAHRISVSWDESDNGITAVSVLQRLLEQPEAQKIEALIIGLWGLADQGDDSGAIIDSLAEQAGELPNLKALFIGDMTFEDCEISWINHASAAPLLSAYPNLKELKVRGNACFGSAPLQHHSLQKITIETGGLSKEVFDLIADANFPSLSHLELWMGDGGYGCEVTIDDIARLLKKRPLENLRYLGLRNCEFTDEIAALLATLPSLGGVETLDLSLGTLGDDGVHKLADWPALDQLKVLDIHHHYASEDAINKLIARGVTVNHEDKQEDDPDDDRYVAVSE